MKKASLLVATTTLVLSLLVAGCDTKGKASGSGSGSLSGSGSGSMSGSGSGSASGSGSMH